MISRRLGPSVLVFFAVIVLVVGPAPAVAPVALAGVGPAPVGRGVAVAPSSLFRWPLDGTPAVLRPFDPPAKPWLPGHRGVDLAAEPGASVRAAGAGVVLFAGLLAGRGVVSVVHAGGLRTTYEPVAPAVHTGDRVGAGDLIGRLVAGHPGCGSFADRAVSAAADTARSANERATACLHWGLRRGDAYLDPLALLGRARVRLLPTGPAITGRAGRTRRSGGKPPWCVDSR